MNGIRLSRMLEGALLYAGEPMSLRFAFLFVLPWLISPALAQVREVDFGLPPGFVAEEIYRVPKNEQGSWICLTVDPQGRLITSDQSGSLYRIDVPEPGSYQTASAEKIELDIGMAMGLQYAFDSLYVMVNGRTADGPGLYRLRDTNDDDQYDSSELLRAIEPPGNPGAGHGNHAIVPGADGESLYLVCGNMAGFPRGGFDSSRVPENWDEDQLLPRLPDGRGHASKTMAPGGWIARTDRNGKHWELICSGFRNVYDAAINRHGDLFTYDADMEFDLGTPWYRPTRICHVVSGGEFGWRNGSGKWPAYYPDSLPSVCDIGLGSPTGMTFGYDTNFPPPLREAMFFCDWSYGRIYVANLSRDGGSYSGNHRLFASFAPLPVVDLVVHPQHRSMYLVTGGRKVQSHVYRIRYKGNETDAGSLVGFLRTNGDADGSDELHQLRKDLERLHEKGDDSAVQRIWPHLNHSDRSVRYAARVALEHQPTESWAKRLASEANPRTILAASLALARAGVDVGPTLGKKLTELRFTELDTGLQLEWLRVWSLAFIRHGKPDTTVAEELGSQLLAEFPSGNRNVDRELGRMLAFLQTEGTIAKTLDVLDAVDATDDQMHFALTLRGLDRGWTIEQRRRYFEWFLKAKSYVGGRSSGEFVRQIRADAEATLTEVEREELAALFTSLDRPDAKPAPVEPLPFIKNWSVTDLLPERDTQWSDVVGRAQNPERGKKLFAAAACSRCHQVRGQGGRVGPDLSGATRRFSPRDLLEAVIHPSKAIPHEFRGFTVVTTAGKIVAGQIVNYSAKGMSIRTNQMEPWKLTSVRLEDVDEIVPSTTSMMPKGLLNGLRRDDVFDLLAWLASQQ